MSTELLTDPTHTRGDLRQIETAIRKGWTIPEQVFEKAGLVISQILTKGSNREKVAAMKCLLAMNEQNTPPQPVLVAHQHIHQVASNTTESDVERKRRELSGRIARLR
jgi:hypothetical protein